MVMMFALPIEASAAAKVTATTNVSKAKRVKTGKTVVTVPKSRNFSAAYLKFTAPATRTYKFTFNNIRKYGRKSTQDIESMWIALETKKKRTYGTYYERINLKQNGERTNSLYLESKYSWSISKTYTKKITADIFVPSRTASLRLKKGQTIYITAGTDSHKVCYDLTIK